MLLYPMLFGSLLLSTGVAAVACALYTVYGHFRPAINRAFLAASCALLFWGTGLGLRVLAANQTIATIGSLIASVGYATMFCFLLHYILLLTGRHALLKKRWICMLLYAPGAISVFGLAVLPLMGRYSYALRRTPLGWINDTLNGWVIFYYAYYTVFLLLSIVFLCRWVRESDSRATRKQAGLLIGALLIAAVLGTLTDVLSGFAGNQLPGIAVVFSLLPIVAVSYFVHRFGFMRPADVSSSQIILDRPAHSRMYQILAFTFLACSVLNVIIQRFLHYRSDIRYGLLFSTLLLAAGCFLLIIIKRLRDEAFRELLVAICIALIVPLCTLQFYLTASISIWVYAFLLLVCSMLFNQRLLLITVSLSAALSQLLLWGAVPDIGVRLGAVDYVIRLALIAIAAFLGFYVNRVYLHRLRENAEHATKQQIIADISHSFVSVTEDTFYDTVFQMLARCGTFLRCDYAYVALPENEPLQHTCEWLAEGAASRRVYFENNIGEILTALREQPTGQPIVLDDAQALPQQRADVMLHLLKNDIRGLVLLPITQGGKVIGFISFAGAEPMRQWHLDSPMFLSILANIMADAVSKINDVQRLHYIAYHDQLTGLPNRFLFKDRLNHAIPLAKRTAKVIGIVFLDLDSFKAINDTMGHALGDQILIQVAGTLRAHVRAYDTIARFGGDEFVLLLDQLNGTADLLAILEKLMTVLHKPFLLDGHEFFLTSSIGAALFPQDGQDAETLLKNADIAMYHAKEQGKNRYTLCTQDLKDKVVDQMKLVNLLYRAQDKQQFSLHYQPQVNLETGTVVGLEALLRWQLPDRGFVGPSVFIPLAEQTGLIQNIGAWVLETACAQCKRWQQMGFPPVRMAVNISLHQLNSPNFVQQIADVLHKTGLAPEYLELEVTESVANGGVQNIVQLLTQLKELGISLSIDDFGTEYSSLSRLKLLPVDRLKLDMQFIRSLETSEKDRAITRVIISLAKSLHMKVIAEGVENANQLDFLIHKMCDEVQGYYYFKPMPADEVEKLLRATYNECLDGRSLP